MNINTLIYSFLKYLCKVFNYLIDNSEPHKTDQKCLISHENGPKSYTCTCIRVIALHFNPTQHLMIY